MQCVIVISERRVNVSTGTWLRAWEHNYKSENVRARARMWVWSLNDVMPRVRDKVWGQEMKSKVATRFWYEGEVLLVFWYVQGSIYIMWNFKMKSWQSINFTACAKDQWIGAVWLPTQSLRQVKARAKDGIWLTTDKQSERDSKDSGTLQGTPDTRGVSIAHYYKCPPPK